MVAVSYCSWQFQGMRNNDSKESYVFDLLNPRVPVYSLRSADHITSLMCHQREPALVGGGCLGGQVGLWDDRVAGGGAVALTDLAVSHTDLVTRVQWVSNKGCNEFMTGSGDGTVKWWDVRQFGAPIDNLFINVRNKVSLLREHVERCHGPCP